MRTITNRDNIIDSRDVIRQFDDLNDDRANLVEACEPGEDRTPKMLQEAREALAAWDEENGEEFKALKEFAEEGESNISEWSHGETLIHDDYFERYAQELAEDLGALKDANSWPLTCIDWEKAARELQYDYTSIEWDGQTYWGRS